MDMLTESLNVLAALVTGVGVAFVVGVFKTVDSKITAKLGNLTPIVVAALSVVLPKAAAALGIADIPDAQTFVNAPLSTAVAIAVREFTVKVKRRVGP